MAVIGNSYYTLDEAARTLGIHYLTLWRRIRRYNVPTIRAGWSILVKLEDVQHATTTVRREETTYATTRKVDV